MGLCFLGLKNQYSASNVSETIKHEILSNLNKRSETPPNTPQRARAAARDSERNSRTLDSPQHRRTPHQPVHPVIPPLRFNNIPVPQVPLPRNPPPQNPPPPQNAIPPDNLFAPRAPVYFNGRLYYNLDPGLAQQVQNVNQAHGNPLPVSIFCFFFLCFYVFRYLD